MLQPRSLLRGEITYSTAKREEVNILHRLGYPNKRTQFLTHLVDESDWIKAIVGHHLNLESSDLCHVTDVENWRHGSFNICIPVTIDNWEGRQQPGRRVLLRFPLPYRVGDAFRPRNGDEKIRCEAGTYAWLEDNCPDVPIPRLYGFAMSTGETFTRLQQLPFLTRTFQYLRRCLLSWLGRPLPSQYVRHQPERQEYSDKVVGAGYLLIEYIEDTQGEMLSNTWSEKQHDVTLRTTFFRDLSRILLSITRISLSRIGSFVIDNDGFLHMTNRPLTLEIQDLENEGIPTYISRNYTYSTVESYVMDVLGFHDSRLQNQPNAINDTGDYLYQTAALATMRTVFSSFFQREYSRGPFVFTLTDLHQSNIFVDKGWRITSLVDLEWACSRPIEMIRTPTWLTNKAVDEISEEPEEYDMMRKEFIKILADEEDRTPWTDNHDSSLQLSAVMKQSWEMGTFWFSLALASPTGLFAVFYKQIQPIFLTSPSGHETFEQIMPWYWARDFVKIATRKISDRKEYDIQLRKAFEDESITDRDIHTSE